MINCKRGGANDQKEFTYALPRGLGRCVLACNYLPEDEERLTSILKHMKIDVLDTSGWHHAHFAVYDMFGKRLGVPKPPKKILPILYETTLCPSCRKWCLELMAKYRMITPEIREECAYDCYEDTRKAYKNKKGERFYDHLHIRHLSWSNRTGESVLRYIVFCEWRELFV